MPVLGAILFQGYENNLKPLGFYSKKFSSSQQRRATYYRELTAVRDGINHFRPYLLGRKFTLLSDHLPLTFLLMSKRHLSSTMARILEELSQYDFTIKHISGDRMPADFLSRLEVSNGNVTYASDMTDDVRAIKFEEFLRFYDDYMDKYRKENPKAKEPHPPKQDVQYSLFTEALTAYTEPETVTPLSNPSPTQDSVNINEGHPLYKIRALDRTKIAKAQNADPRCQEIIHR